MSKIEMKGILSLVVMSAGLTAQSIGPARTLVTQAIDESKLVTNAGNTRPEAKVAANDRGVVPDTRTFQHMLLLLNRPAEREVALQQYLAGLSNPKAANYHRWLTAKQVGEKFGPNQLDIQIVKEWLGSHGLTVNAIASTGTLIDFSGNAKQIRAAFHTEIHNLTVRGENHIANMSDPKFPAALVELVKGIASLNDFHPRSMVKNMHAMNVTSPDYTASGGRYLVAPPDLATIYNANPLYSLGLSGQGQTVLLLERTDLVSSADWLAFRKRFALTKAYPYATLSQIHPQSPFVACSDPGVNSDDGEAEIDVQWSSAAAPNANIILASCLDDEFTFGPFTALENLLLGSTPPPAIMSLSYGGPESEAGAGFNAYTNLLYELADLEGVSVFVSAGDNDAAQADARDTPAQYGISVNGLASTPYNVAVGGTDYGDSYLGVNSTYWNSTTAPNGQSAKSYIPEIPWNASCGSELIANYLGYATSYGATGLCNSPAASTDGLLNVVGGSGGPSACAYGSPDPPTNPVVSGTCSGYLKPYWQSLAGVPNDGVRDLPDVSLFAASGTWGHYYLFCYSDTTYGGVPCNQGLFGAGGTSFGAPIMAGYQALVNQYTGFIWGNTAPVLYALGNLDYGPSGNPSCNSSLGTAVSAACTFHDVTLGDNVAACKAGTPNCYAPSGAIGVLSTSTTSYQPAFSTTTGWDFATGIGTPNVYNLVTNFLTGAFLAYF